jgi:hypothetical protein
MSAATAPARPARAVASEPTLSLHSARGMAFFALAAFGSLHWMVLLDPAAPGRALYALAAAAIVMVGLRAAARLGDRLRPVAATAVAVVVFPLALMAGGVADEFLRPDEWGALASGISRGIESLPGVRVPYRGVDEWTRIAIGLGGTVLVVAAAIAAFWPRRSGTGFPPVALGLLVALYAIPAVALDFENEFLRGAALALLVLAFLRLEKLRLGDAGTAAMVAAGVAVLALMLAPALDGDEPWWDYERWALGAASSRSTSFSWNHDYGPLDWPRDGRELLRVKARHPAYWKAANLDGFDGIGWREISSPDSVLEPEVTDPRSLAQDRMRIEVTIRNLSSRAFVTAGDTDVVDAPGLRESARGDGTWVASRPLRRGDSYAAEVYAPQADSDEREEADDSGADTRLARYRRLVLPGGNIGQSGTPHYQVDVPAFRDPFQEVEVRRTDQTQALPLPEAAKVLEEGGYGRSWRLAQQIKASARNQEEIVQAVMAFLRRDPFTYSETPPRRAQTLDGFLFDARTGYCQQYSGSMALLLRMAGVPARVVTGFTSGSQDSKTKEYVVRDLDAHSWVEVWYGGIGWVTFDPTPASAPPRAQPDEASAQPGGGNAPGAPDLGGDLPSDPGRRAAAVEPGTSWGWIAAAAVGGLALAGALALLVVRHRRRVASPPSALALADLERALRRARLDLGPATTLRALERRFARSPAAAGYVRTISDLRFGGRGGGPTPAQRRGLRAELGRGNGVLGRLRAWWALPPRTR